MLYSLNKGVATCTEYIESIQYGKYGQKCTTCVVFGIIRMHSKSFAAPAPQTLSPRHCVACGSVTYTSATWTCSCILLYAHVYKWGGTRLTYLTQHASTSSSNSQCCGPVAGWRRARQSQWIESTSKPVDREQSRLVANVDTVCQ